MNRNHCAPPSPGFRGTESSPPPGRGMHAVLPADWAAARLAAARRTIVTRRDGGCAIELPEAALRSLQATVASTLGHFSHASSRRIVLGLWRRHSWLRAVFELSPAADRLWARAEPASVASLVGQARVFPPPLSGLHARPATRQPAGGTAGAEAGRGAASSRPRPHRCPVAAAALVAADAATPCPGAGARLSENGIQAPGVPFALVARARSRHRSRGRAIRRDKPSPAIPFKPVIGRASDPLSQGTDHVC